MLTWSALMFLVSVVISQANAKSVCLCDIGQVQREKGFYRAGCSLWLNQQKCDSKKTIDREHRYSLARYVTDLKAGDKLIVGYVGHWSNAWETVNFIERELVPLAQKTPIQIIYDNTACRPMNDAESVQETLNQVEIATGSSIYVKGSQTLSVGMWEGFLPGTSNFYAHASTEWSRPRYWDCADIENVACSARFQFGESGLCLDTSSRTLIRLTCIGNSQSAKWRR